MSLVWKSYAGGGGDLLVMLALADRADDEGGSLFPSVPTIAKKTRLSERQVQRILRNLEDEGWVSVVGNHKGGAGMSRRYQMNVQKLTESDPNLATKKGDILSPLEEKKGDILSKRVTFATEKGDTHVTQYIIDTSVNTSDSQKLSDKPKKSKPQITLKTYLENCKAENRQAVESNDSIFGYAESIGLPIEFLYLCWEVFKRDFSDPSKKQKDWPAHFRNCVRGNWKKLWWLNANNQFELTTVGRQAQLEFMRKTA